MTQLRGGRAEVRLFGVIAALFVTIAVGFVYGRVRIGTDPAGGSVGDLITLYFPLLKAGYAALRGGHLPLWTPQQGCGAPLLGDPEIGLFYPVQLPFLWLPADTAVDLNIVVHLSLAALAMFALGRRWGLGWIGGTCAGLAYAYQGSTSYFVYYPTFLAALACVPLIFLGVDAVIGRPSASTIAGLAAAIGLALLGAYFQFLYFTGLALIPYLAVRAISSARAGGTRRLAQIGGGLTAAAVLGVAVGMIRVLPGADYMAQSWRPPGTLSIDAGAIMSEPLGSFLRGIFTPGPPPAGAWAEFLSFFTTISYVGTAVLILSATGLALWRNRTVAWPLATAGIASVLYAVGPASPIYQMALVLPGGRSFRGPSRALLIFGFSMALLAGAGLDELVRSETTPRRRAALALVAVAAIATVAFGRALGDPRGWWLLTVYATLTVVLAGCAALSRTAVIRGGAAAVLTVLVGVDLILAKRFTGALPSKLSSYFSRNDSLWDTIRARQDLARTYIWAQFDAESPLRFFSDVGKAGLNHGLWLPTDYAVAGKRLEGYLAKLGAEPPFPFGYVEFDVTPANVALARLMGIRFYVGTEKELAQRVDPAVRSEWTQASVLDQIRLYEDPLVLPRTFIVHDVHVVPDPDRALQHLTTVDSATVAVLEEPLDLRLAQAPPASRAEGEVARIVDYQPERVTIETDSQQPGLLVLTDQYWPGWEATVDQRPAPLYRADYLFRGVPLPIGSHRVEIVYRPRSVLIGAAVTFIGVSSITILLVWARLKRDRTSRSALPPSAGRGTVRRATARRDPQ